MTGDLLVRGGQVIDGTGSPAIRQDVRIRQGTIVELGVDLAAHGEEILDAAGAWVTPGFIDSHTHFDASLFWDPLCDPMPQHGVTTVVIGNCSLSLAPLFARQRDGGSETFAFIEDIPLKAFQGLPWTWESYPEYVTEMRARQFGVNVVGLIGHSMLRLAVLGSEAWDRPATVEELAALTSQLSAALDAGARGLSISYFDRGADGRPVPSSQADDTELRALIEVLGRHRAHLELIPMSVGLQRDEAVALLERLGEWCGLSNVSMSWNGFLDIEGDPGLSETFLDVARRLQGVGIQAYPQMSPRPIELTVDFEQTMSFMYLTEWNSFVQGNAEDKHKMLTDQEWRLRAAQEWDQQELEFFPHRHLERVRIAKAPSGELQRWVGQSLGDWALDRGGHPSDALADWIVECALNPRLNYVVGNSNPARVGALCADEATIVSASDAGAHLRMFCASGDTTLLLTRHVRERGDLSLESAVHALTSRQAEVFGLSRLGQVAPGKAGDLVIFALDELNWDEEEVIHDIPPDQTPGSGALPVAIEPPSLLASSPRAGERPRVLYPGGGHLNELSTH